MTDGGPTLRQKLPQIAIEAAMVPFAVFATFGVEEWREERQLRRLAAATRSAVETEVSANLAEFRTTEPVLTGLTADLERRLRASREHNAELGGLNLEQGGLESLVV